MKRLKNIIYIVSLITASASAVYAAKEMVHSFKEFNETINSIDCISIRKEIRHLDEMIQMRQK